MIKKLSIFLAVVLTAIVLVGCPALLTTELPSDTMISLGLINAVEGATELRTAVGGDIIIPVYISSTGTTTSYTVTFTLEDDSDLSTDGVDLGSQSITAGTETMVELTIPASVTDATAANYTELYASFTAAADDPGLEVGDETLNVAMVPILIETAGNYLPDLKISFVAPESRFRTAESTFPLSYKISNEGYKSLASETVITTDFSVEIDGADIELGTASVTLTEPLYPLSFVTSSTTITMPTLAQMATDNTTTVDDLEAWSDDLTGTVDPDDAIAESVEDDTDTFVLESGTEKPYLSIISFDAPSSVIVEGPVEISFSVENNGYAVAASGEYGVMLFHDVAGDGAYDSVNDTTIYEWTAVDCPNVPWDKEGDNLNNNVAFTTLGLDVNYPASMTAGVHDIGVRITGTLDEWGNGNADAYVYDVEFSDTDVDLEPGLISTSYLNNVAATTDVTIPVTILIKNNGTETIDTDFDVEFYRSADGTLDTADDTLLNTVTITNSVGTGGIGQIELNTDLDFTGTTPGFYTIYAVVDSANELFETDETNNQVSTASASPLYILVQDSTTPVDMDVNLVICTGGTSDVDGYIYLYDTAWNFYSYIYIDNLQDGMQYVSETLIRDEFHGVRFFSFDYDAETSWRIVPGYVTSISSDYWPEPLTSTDQYEDNDSSTAATDLDALGINPFAEWIQSYDSSVYDYDYYTFTM